MFVWDPVLPLTSATPSHAHPRNSPTDDGPAPRQSLNLPLVVSPQMPRVASLVLDHARRNHHILVPLLFVFLAATANVHSPVQHQLLIASASWAVVCVLALFWTGVKLQDGARRRISWLAGGFLALSLVCDRAACDKEGVWATKVWGVQLDRTVTVLNYF